MAKTRYVWSSVSDSVLQEKDGTTGVTQVTYTNEPALYGPLRSERRGSETRQYHFDALGSTRALTDDSQTVTDTFAYDAWGVRFVSNGQSSVRYQWLGRQGFFFAVKSVYFLPLQVFSASLARYYNITPPTSARSYSYLFSSNSPTSPAVSIQASKVNGPFGLFFKILGSSSESCTVQGQKCPCEQDDCIFVVGATGVKNSDGTVDAYLVFTYSPGKTIKKPNPKKPFDTGPDPAPCAGDFGRTALGSLTVTTPNSGGPCDFTQRMFSDPNGNPIDAEIPDRCKGIIGEPIAPVGGNPRGIYGTLFPITGATSISIDMTIETFCGCGGFDNLGRPLNRNKGSLTISGTIP